MKNKIEIINNIEVENLYNDIKLLVEESKRKVYKMVNTEMINLYWSIGKMIVDKQGEAEKAKYKDYIIQELSMRLTSKFGKGFSKRNLERMRKFYICYPIATTMLSQLTCSHYLELIKIDDEDKRNFYMHECINSSWNVRELQRQRETLLYERIIISKDKNKVKELRTKEKMTQQKLADLVSVSSRTIISLEKGNYSPSLMLAYKIARVFNTTIEDLYCLKENLDDEDI